MLMLLVLRGKLAGGLSEYYHHYLSRPWKNIKWVYIPTHLFPRFKYKYTNMLLHLFI